MTAIACEEWDRPLGLAHGYAYMSIQLEHL